jgi:glutamate:GABA antiporter
METVSSQPSAVANLKRTLGRLDLVLLFVVAVVNLNVVPSIASGGAVTLWLWLLALVFFFWPQGIAVIELSQRFPGEGGVYLWSKKYFGDFHGFLSGWCYWTNNIFYVPTVLLYLVGTALFVLGPRGVALANNSHFTFFAGMFALAFVLLLNVLGLGVGKWINNLGGIGTSIAAVVLIGLGITSAVTRGVPVHAHDFALQGADWRLIASFGYICFGLVGLELASVMGDEIRDPRKELPPAVAIGGVLSGLLYMGATLTLLIAVPKESIGVLQGVLQAVDAMAHQVGVPWIVTPVTLVLSVSIAGIASAWFAGSARIPFVAGLDHYMPAVFGKVNARTGAPYVVMLVSAVLSAIFWGLSVLGSTAVKDSFKLLLALATVLQLVPFVYVYAALLKIAFGAEGPARYRRMTLKLAGVSGLITTVIGIAVAFVPPSEIQGLKPVLRFEGQMIFGTLFFIVTAALLFFIYGKRRRIEPVAVGV